MTSHPPVPRDTSPLSVSRVGQQRGYATLTTGVIMLLLLSLMTVYATRSGILDIRTSADRVRFTEGMAQAEHRVERGYAWVMANRDDLDPNTWTGQSYYGSCNGQTALPCGDGNTNRYDDTYRYSCHGENGGHVNCILDVTFYLVAQIPAPGSPQREYDIVAQGQSADFRSKAVVKQGLHFYSLGSMDEVPAPFVAAGNVTSGGNFHLVANPDGGGSGVPVSVWTPNDVANLGSASSCQIYEFTANGNQCPASDALSASTQIGPDIVDNAPNFPSDLFEYIFGVPGSNYQSIKNKATNITNCNALNSSSKGIFWYSSTTGTTCAPSGDVGSASGPVVLVVEDQNFDYTSNNTFYGIVFSFSPNSAGKEVKFAGTGTLRGTVITDNPNAAGQVINGTFKLVYDSNMMGVMQVSHSYMGLAKLPGSWADYLN